MKELKIVRDLLNALNEKVSYCHWKSNEHFDKALIGVDDLDILVDKNDLDKLLKILSDLKFKHFYTPSSRTYIGIEDYLGFDSETGTIIHLHLHFKLVVGEKHLKGFYLPIEKDVLKNRRFDEKYNAYFSSYFDELLLLIVRLGMKNRKRDFFKNKIFEKNTYTEYEWLKKKCTNFEESLIKTTWINPALGNLILRVYNGDFKWMTMRKMKRVLYRDYKCYSLGSGLYNTIKRNSHELNRIRLEILKRYLPSNNTFLRRRSQTGGTIIAFVGSDGSGKSSSIKEVQSWLKKVVDVRYFYLGSGDGNSSALRKPLKAMKSLGKKAGVIKTTNNFNDTNLNDKKDTSNAMSFARKIWVYALSKERIKKIVKATRCRTRGFIVLTDRYPQNEYDGLCDGPKLRNERGHIANVERESFRMATLCPPDLAIKLIVSPEVALQRKPNEINVEVSKNLTERVKKIQFSERTKIVTINADQEQKEVILAIKRAIWENI